MTDPRVERTRREVLSAGRQVLIDEGISAITFARVAEVSGIGRRTLYRHWSDNEALIKDVLASGEVPHARITGDLRADLIAHLDALRQALTLGNLDYVVCALGERARADERFEAIRAELTEQGCAVAKEVLVNGRRAELLPAELDVAAALAALEGPVFYRAMIRRERMTRSHVEAIVDGLLLNPPVRSTNRRR
jgi:AcrR family transcriptional regulator